jgi:hypothetical protein
VLRLYYQSAAAQPGTEARGICQSNPYVEANASSAESAKEKCCYYLMVPMLDAAHVLLLLMLLPLVLLCWFNPTFPS